MSFLSQAAHYLPGMPYFRGWRAQPNFGFQYAQPKSVTLGSKLLCNIFEYLPPSDLIRWHSVSKNWHLLILNFPQQLVVSKIHENVNAVLLRTTTNMQEENAKRVCRVLHSLLMAHQSHFQLSLAPGKFLPQSGERLRYIREFDKAYNKELRNCLQHLEKARWSVSSLAKLPLEKVSQTFIEAIVSLQYAEGTSLCEKNLYYLLKQRLADKECVPSSPVWEEIQAFIDHLDCNVLGAILLNGYLENQCQDDYCFVVLLKMAFRQPWELPASSSLSKETYLKKTFSFSETGDYTLFIELPRFIQLLLYRDSRAGKRFLYEQCNMNLFYTLFPHSLVNIPCETWKEKGHVILDYFETFKWQSTWGNLLASAHDTKTQEIGNCFTHIFSKDISPRQRTEWLHHLQKLVPDLNSYVFSLVFGHLHPPFLNEYINGYPSCVRPLTFKPARPVIHCGDLCIGFSNKGFGTLVSLLAFHAKSERLLWEIHPLDLFSQQTKRKEFDLFYWRKSDTEFALMHQTSTDLLLIDAAEGTVKRAIIMPARPVEQITKLYVSPCGFSFYSTRVGQKTILFGGEIGEKWTTRFQLPCSGLWQAQEDFISCLDVMQDFSQIIIDRTGNTFKIPHCYDLRISGDYLYTLDEEGRVNRQKIHADKDRFALTGPKVSITFDSQLRGKFVGICEDGTIVCEFLMSKMVFYFIRFESKQLLTKTKEVAGFSNYFLDKKKGVLWTWDKYNKELWAHTFEGSKKVAYLDAGSDLKFLYIDHKNRLCCIHEY